GFTAEYLGGKAVPVFTLSNLGILAAFRGKSVAS
ncbi:unnamed protein product, partial [marine sediment metagenome]